MHIKKIYLRLVLCASALALIVCGACGCSSGKTSSSFDYKTDISEVKDVLNTTDKKYLLLVNKQNPVGSDHLPDGLTSVNTEYTNGGKAVQMEASAAKAAEAMIAEMRVLGMKNACITSGYRSYAYQEWLFSEYRKNEMSKDPSLTAAEAEKKVLTYSAQPGTSEHHTGLCMDLFVSDKMLELENYGYEGKYPNDVGFAETDEFKWLQENAHKFGFILRYPSDKVDITEYSYESWHYRFVGIAAASEIYEKGLTLEEYLAK